GPAVLLARRRRPAGLVACPLGRRSGGQLPAGRVDDHPAVREERLRGQGADAGQEGARGGAGEPTRPGDEEGRAPVPLPLDELLRWWRLRGGGGEPDVLPQAGQPAHVVGGGPSRRA